MIHTNERVEQRQHKRFHVQSGAFVILRPSENKVGRLLDISMGGLSFACIENKEQINGSYLDIWLSQCNFYLDEVPIKTILDFEMAYKPPLSSVTARRYKVEFGKLTDEQRAQLEFFIKNYTVGEA
jgi:hypothetical protein